MSGVLGVLDRYCNSILPGKLWDGTNPYCHRPGRESSEYSKDLAALCEARAAIAELIEAAKGATEEKVHDGASSKAACDRLISALAKVEGDKL